MDKKIGYAGWVGHNNVGDEALLEANQLLFDEFEFVDSRYWSEYDSLLFGGGTILPQFLVGGGPQFQRGGQCTAAIGVGVRSQMFWNRKMEPIDIRYFAGRAGVSELTRNKYVEYLLKPIEYLSSSAIATGYYFSESDYHSIKEYNFDYLGVRGPLSREALSKYAIECEVVGDTALALEPSSEEIQRQKKVAVCLQSDKLKWAKNEKYLNHVVEFLSEIESEYKIVLLPFQKEDISIHINMLNNLQNACFKNYCSPMDVQGVIDEIASCEFMIGEKLHSNILSACSYTPFLSLEYRPKCLDFATSVGMDSYNIRIDRLDKEKLNSLFTELENDSSVTSHLKSEVNKRRNHLQKFADKISRDLK
ncbi:polysaccharide pyruvyl transferase family protein [Halorubrum saccharovorum]|uniref:polysaccharide pyruvyl transferase family protein n=1 Tax=Halorubrum saccharovorum TaxID=2248 RepID=UPI001364E223|nr:polysaccharide pyruvyl transferase family protein [Halorubrum saccharovorum]